MPGTETASASTPTVVSATTTATPNSTSGALSRRPSKALLSQHSSTSGFAFPNRSSPPNSLSRFPTVSSLASARDGTFDSTAAAAVAGHQTKTFQERRRGSQQDLYSSLLRPDRSRSASPSAAAPLPQRRLLSRSSSSSSSRDTHVHPPPTPVVAAAAAPPGASVQPRSPPASRLQPFRSSSSRSSMSIGSSPVQQRPQPPHSSSGDGNVSTMVSATTAGQSSTTNIAVSQRGEGAEEGGAERRRGLPAGSRNLSINTSNSAAFTLLAGPPPPSGLRDPVTLLQLLPVDLLLQPTAESPLGPSSGTLKQQPQPQHPYSTVERRERGRQAPTTPSTPASPSSLACNYRRAFSLLRCAKQPVASLHSSLAWQTEDGSDSLEATLGSVMMELMHRSYAAGAPLSSPQIFSPAPRTSAPYAHRKDQQNRAGGGAVDGEEAVPLCSLAATALGETSMGPNPSAGRDDEDVEDDDVAAAEAGVVPLLCFAATVECPPDIRRCLLLSRTHAYLCDLDGTIAYCAAIHDVRQVVTCAGGYMVWRFVPDALVRTMYTVNTGEERRRVGEAVATSTGGGARPSRSSNPPSLPAAPRMSGGGAATAASSAETPATVWGTRDEMSDWVFRILSVGVTSSPTPATATAAATTGSVLAASHMESGGGDAAPLLAASPRDDGLAEERMSALVFLVELMCTLRTLPRLLMDAVVAGSATTPLASASVSEEGFSQPQLYNSSDVQRLRLRSARSQSTDQLDRMHVPGDRPARVPLLLEGAVGHQTAVKFVEHYWTTRYDQLPPLLRPRRLLAAGAGPTASSTSPSTVEGGRGARVCRVVSSLHIPVIPVAALSACLGAEESVTSMLETARGAALASLTEERSRPGRGEAPPPFTPATAASATHALSLKDMRSPAAQADAQATLSPAAWRILQSMLRPDDPIETSAPPQRTHHAPHHFVPATGLTTPTTPNAAQTRAHSEDGPSLSSRSSASSSSGAAAGGPTSPTSSSAEAAVTRGTAASRNSSSYPLRAEGGEEGDEAARSHPLCNDMICAVAEAQPADACPSTGTGTTYSEKDEEAPAATTADAERVLTPLSAVHEEPQRLNEARAEISLEGECLSAGGKSPTTKSGSSSTTTSRSRFEEVRHEGPISAPPSRSALSTSALRAITAARLRRQRRAGTEEQTDDAVAVVTTQHTNSAEECLSSPSLAATTGKRTDSAVTDVLPPPVAPAPPDVSVEAFERRVAHRPARDRLVLRARYIQQLLQPPLLSSANAVGNGGHSERQAARSHAGACQGAIRSLPDDEADRLVEDLRRQRMIAELMLHQQREDAELKALTAAAATIPAGGPPRDEVGGPRWRATALQERAERNSRPDSYY